MSPKYYILYKPFGVLCQFTSEHNKRTLGDVFDFPKNVYSVGRLDENSEGLLLLTNDRKVNGLLLDPNRNHIRTYHVQIEGQINNKAITQLSRGVEIKLKNGENYTTRPAKVKRMGQPNVEARETKISFNKEKGHSWVSMKLTEGKYRQVRKMTAAVGFPTIRLIRNSIEDLSISGMKSGDVMEIPRDTFYKRLKIG